VAVIGKERDKEAVAGGRRSVSRSGKKKNWRQLTDSVAYMEFRTDLSDADMGVDGR
jgi:hypothetical protein